MEAFDFEIANADMAELDNLNLLWWSLGERVSYA